MIELPKTVASEQILVQKHNQVITSIDQVDWMALLQHIRESLKIVDNQHQLQAHKLFDSTICQCQ